jgi:hypothetical protein
LGELAQGGDESAVIDKALNAYSRWRGSAFKAGQKTGAKRAA